MQLAWHAKRGIDHTYFALPWQQEDLRERRAQCMRAPTPHTETTHTHTRHSHARRTHTHTNTHTHTHTHIHQSVKCTQMACTCWQESRLLAAARYGNLRTIVDLLAQGANLEARDDQVCASLCVMYQVSDMRVAPRARSVWLAGQLDAAHVCGTIRASACGQCSTGCKLECGGGGQGTCTLVYEA